MKLVQMGRVDEARREAASLSDYELLEVARRIEARLGQRHLARDFLSTRMDSTHNTIVLEQLLAWAREDGDTIYCATWPDADSRYDPILRVIRFGARSDIDVRIGRLCEERFCAISRSCRRT